MIVPDYPSTPRGRVNITNTFGRAVCAGHRRENPSSLSHTRPRLPGMADDPLARLGRSEPLSEPMLSAKAQALSRLVDMNGSSPLSRDELRAELLAVAGWEAVTARGVAAVMMACSALERLNGDDRVTWPSETRMRSSATMTPIGILSRWDPRSASLTGATRIGSVISGVLRSRVPRRGSEPELDAPLRRFEV